MAQFKVIISDKKGKAISLELKDREAQPLIGTKIGDPLDSNIFGISEGKIVITGGSDKSGTSMRKDVHGGVKKYVLLSKGIGMRNSEDGIRKRKLVRGNIINEDIYQINCQLVEGNLPPGQSSKIEESPSNSDK